MLTHQEILFGIVLPLILALLLGGLAAAKRWAWLIPLALGAGFLTGYAVLAHPGLPPADGTDWLFWAAIPATLLAVVACLCPTRPATVAGAWAGVTAWLVLRPLPVSSGTLAMVAVGFAMWGMVAVFGLSKSTQRARDAWTVAALCAALGGAAVVILSSNLRTSGVYGIGAAAATGPLVFCVLRAPAARGVAVLVVTVLAGLLVGGKYYPDPGISWPALIALLAAPLLPCLTALLPGRRNWVRGLAGLLAVLILVTAVAAPAALAAKKAAEADPYASYR